MDIFILAGEPSGDVHAAALITALQKRKKLSIFGVGGDAMGKSPLTKFVPMPFSGLIGFTAVFKTLPSLISSLNQLTQLILRENPKIVVFVDYPGFHLKLAERLRRHRFQGKLVHYIAPQVWIWFKRDIEKMERTLDLLLCIFPFEPPLFAHTNLAVKYVGHPCFESIPQQSRQKTATLALFPGSREKVIQRTLPKELAVALRLQKENPDLNIAVSIASQKLKPLIASLVNNRAELVDPPHQKQLIERTEMALASNGTICLELALHGVPTVVHSPYSLIDSFIAKHFLKVKQPCCIVNILAKKTIYPELFYWDNREESLFKTVQTVYRDKIAQERCRLECQKVRELLATPHLASENSATYILELLH